MVRNDKKFNKTENIDKLENKLRNQNRWVLRLIFNWFLNFLSTH